MQTKIIERLKVSEKVIADEGEIDIFENQILDKYPNILEILLRDNTTKQNIIWATNNYVEYGSEYLFEKPILIDQITGQNGNIITPRVKKHRDLQKSRSKGMAEVFTPSWVCNCQNNIIDTAWFGVENVFNTEIEKNWDTNKDKIKFSKGKRYKDYINDTRLEITCGEAPYLTSRYDTTTGEFIAIQDRIGLLDRKLRLINENEIEPKKWLKMAELAYQNIYGFEWQGDSLLLAREALLFTFIENYQFRYGKEPDPKNIQTIAEIISWNIWQMDGLKGVIPKSCKTIIQKSGDLFGETEIETECEGCKKKNIHKHNGVYSLIKDWEAKDLQTGKKGTAIRFVDLIKKTKV